MKIKLANVRIAFPQLFVAKAFNGEGKATFNATFLLDPADPQVKVLQTSIDTVGAETWNGKATEILKTLKASDKTCLHNGDLKSAYDGFAGNLYLSANNPTRPLVLDADKSPLNAQDGRPYSGCFVNASIEIWAQDNNYGKRVNATLLGVQFFKDGEPFVGGGVASGDDFDDVSTGATADDLV